MKIQRNDDEKVRVVQNHENIEITQEAQPGKMSGIRQFIQVALIALIVI